MDTILGWSSDQEGTGGDLGLFLSLSASTWVCSACENPSGCLHTSHLSISFCVWYLPPDSKEMCIKCGTGYLFNFAMVVKWPALPMGKALWSHFTDQPDETECRPHTLLGVDLTEGRRSWGDSSPFSSFIIVTTRWPCWSQELGLRTNIRNPVCRLFLSTGCKNGLPSRNFKWIA